MLLILIPLAWLAVIALLVAICVTAARADAAPAPRAGEHLGAIGDRLVLRAAPPASSLASRRAFAQASRRQAVPPLTRRRPAPRRRGIAAHGIH
jgi:hypothetical protein